MPLPRPAAPAAPFPVSSLYAAGAMLWLAAAILFVHAQTSRASVKPRAMDAGVTAMSRAGEPSWQKRFDAITAEARKGDAEVVFLGDSITHGWKFTPLFRERFGKYDALNAGISSDRVEHLLWRVRNGNLDGIRPKVAVVLIGVNNLAVSSPAHIAAGVRQIAGEIHARSPKTKVLVLGLFPSGHAPSHPRRAKIRAVNAKLAALGRLPGVDYADVGARFLEKDGSISKDVMHDGLHLTGKGYRIWADALEGRLSALAKAPVGS